jgi:hypothetical protein
MHAFAAFDPPRTFDDNHQRKRFRASGLGARQFHVVRLTATLGQPA